MGLLAAPFFMKPILIIKAGTTLPELKNTNGDFENWIISKSSKPRNAFIVTSVFENIPLPQPDHISAVIISGSHANVTENLPWMEKTSQWLHKAGAAKIPILGICFGHQIIAHSFGGKVGFNPAGLELGLTLLKSTPAAKTDVLFAVLPDQFRAFVSHQQSVLVLPSGATKLAFSDEDPNQAFRIDSNIWGVQFHPEFNCDITQAYIDFHREELNSQNKKTIATLPDSLKNDWGSVLLKQFVKIVENR